MDFVKNYYAILGINRSSEEKEIKKAYYKLSFTHHPDKGGDKIIFGEISEAYNTLCSDKRVEYDIRSKWGNNYYEKTEILDFEFTNNAKAWDEDKFEDWKKINQLNIVVHIDDTFDGSIEYERFITCKDCGGDGRDTKSKIEIKDVDGNLLKLFDGSDGCDFCEGIGTDWKGEPCYFCGGKGKVGWSDCKTCNGEKRILGKQKLSGIKIPNKEKRHMVEAMGHSSKDERGKVGQLWLVRA